MATAVPAPTIHILPSGLRALILAAAWWVLSLPLTTLSGSAAAAAGGMAAVFMIDGLQNRPRLRTIRHSGTILLAAALLTLMTLISHWITTSSLLATLLGPMRAFHLSQILWWMTAAGLGSALMRHLAQRHRTARLLEIVFVASAFVVALAAHRQGMIHRPYFIGDFALIRGIDPSSILLATGCAAVLCLAALLMVENNHRRLPYHFTALGLLCFALLAWVQFFGMPTPTLTDNLGLTGQAQNRASGNESENPFSDGENNPEDREAPVAVVLFRDDYTPDEGIYYFRESAYSQFNGRMLATASDPALDRDLVRSLGPGETSVEETLPALDLRREVRTTIGLLTEHRRPFGLDAPARFSEAPNPNSLRFQRTYDVVSQVPRFEFPDLLGREIGAQDWTLSQWDEYLTMPDDPRYEELARDLIDGVRPEFAGDPYARAMAIKEYLDENGIYSLENVHASEQDPAGSFLFGDLTGYCVHFAYAATYLYRSIGIPARVGVGYAVPAANRAGGSALLIQAVHGHAWPEIYLQGRGWVIVDPSPSRTLVDMSMDPQDDLQQLLGDMLRDDASFESYTNSMAGESLSLTAILRGLAGMAALLMMLGWIVRLWRQLVPTLCAPDALYRHAYRAALDTLAASGLTRRRGESREAFARRHAARLPALQTLTDAHLAAALGRHRPAGSVLTMPGQAQDAQQAWQSQLRDLDRQLKNTSPWWRRCLATLHPFPWLISH
ncbi:MAG: transglutaminase domain-containing protein [Pseudohongiellaceae bacterium]